MDSSARKVPPALETLQFGRTFTDHMLTVDWNVKTGWTTPLIAEFSNLSLSPAALTLHYGIEVNFHIAFCRHNDFFLFCSP